MSKPAANDQHYCLICSGEMHSHHHVEHSDFSCAQKEDHHFSYRVVEENMILEEGGWSFSAVGRFKMTKMRIRLFDEDGSALRLKMHYDKGYSEVWTVPNSPNRIKINSIVIPDFGDLPKLRNKIKTYLVFG
jgi:hypothetical protein